MEEIIAGINRFSENYGVGKLEKVVLPKSEFNLYGIALSQRYPHVVFEPDDIDGRIYIQRDPN